MKKAFLWLAGWLIPLAFLRPAQIAPMTVEVLFEDNPAVVFEHQKFTLPRGEDLSVVLEIPKGYSITEVSYDRWSSEALSDSQTRLTLYDVEYSKLVRLSAEKFPQVCCHTDLTTAHTPTGTGRLRANTPLWQSEYERDGKIAVGWNTKPDGSGDHAGFGCRPESVQPVTELYLEWMSTTPEVCFRWNVSEEGAVITGCTVQSNELIIPSRLGGLPVVGIQSGAFDALAVDTLVFPPTLRLIEEGAFQSLTANHLFLFDTLTQVQDSSLGDYHIQTLHINAARKPAWCGMYFDSLSEKMDFLSMVQEEKKIILFGGSAYRFGCDSTALEEAFPEYRVVNMGVYAYANMLPQALLLLPYLREGDVVILSPELDAIPQQFCTDSAMDRENFCMLESNYDMLALVDCRKLSGLFDAFGKFQQGRAGMRDWDYSDLPRHYDEEGNRCDTLS